MFAILVENPCTDIAFTPPVVGVVAPSMQVAVVVGFVGRVRPSTAEN